MIRARTSFAAAFTLLEVMIAVAFVGIALIALLSLHQSDMQSVIRAQELSRAAMLAQTVMTQAEMERFPPPGDTNGDFSSLYRGRFRNFRWQRSVTQSPLFPSVCRVEIRVLYGHRYRNRFDLVEFMHNPAPLEIPGQPQQPNGGSGNPANRGSD
jgi:type II secretion system protein I